MKKTIHDIYFDLCTKHVKAQQDIVILQVGSFMESYTNIDGQGCAEELAERLNIVLTKKNSKKEFSKHNPKMAGFPLNNLERHLNLLLDQNYRVTIYEQNPDNVKDRRYRGCFTKNIRMDFDTESSLHNNALQDRKIYSLTIEKFEVKRAQVPVFQYHQTFSYIDLNTGKVFFGEQIDDHYQRMLEQFLLQNQPHEMIVHLHPLFDNHERKNIELLLEEKDFQYMIHETPKKFNSTEMERVLSSSFQHIPEKLYFYPALMFNICSIIDHVKECDPIQVRNLSCDENPFLEIEKDYTMKFNRDLFRELFIYNQQDERSSDSAKRFRSIFDLLSHGMNSMGKRKLLRILNHPLTDQKEIQRRYDYIETFAISTSVFANIEIDMELYYLKWKRSSCNTKLIAKLLLTIKNLSNYYSDASELITIIEKEWNLKKMVENEEFLLHTSEEYQLWMDEEKNNYEKLQDSTSLLMNDLDGISFDDLTFIEDTKNIEDSYFTIGTKKWSKLTVKKQAKFRIISSKTTIKHIMTLKGDEYLFNISKYKRLQTKYRDDRIRKFSIDLFHQFSKFFTMFFETIANDSMYAVLRKFFKENSYQKPELVDSDHSFYDIKGVRHPILELLYRDEVFVPFDSTLTRETSGNLILGINRSGKSTFMKSVATSLFLAQCGLYSPCQSLRFHPYRCMFSKLNHSDNLFKKQSLFYNEISELQFSLSRFQPRHSLFLLDEVFSGTEVPSTIGLLMGIMNELLSQNAQFIISTHLHVVATIAEQEFKKRLRIQHFEMNQVDLLKDKTLVTDSPNIFYTRQLKDGPGEECYGIEIAEKLGLRPSLIETANFHRRHVRLEYDYQREKVSKYNKNIIMKECQICKSRRNLQTHHIYQQQHFTSTSNKHGFDKNMAANLMVLCEICHRKVENDFHEKKNF